MKEEYLEIEATYLTSQQNEHDEKLPINHGAAVEMIPDLQQLPTCTLAQTNKAPQQSMQAIPTDIDAQCDDAMLRKLLRKFQMDFLYPVLKVSDVTYHSLRYLSVDDINTAIRSVGYRAEFREKLFTWRRKRYRTNDPIIEIDKQAHPPANTDIVDLMQTQASQTEESFNENFTSSSTTQGTIAAITEVNNTSNVSTIQFTTATNLPNSANSNNNNDNITQKLQKENIKRKKWEENDIEMADTHRLAGLINLEQILDESLFGSAMKQFYKLNGFLERKHRDELIQLIVDHLTTNDIKLHCCDFTKLTEMIAIVFPSEEYSKEYYFINRKGKRNPMGRLYTKYYNTLKRLKVRDMQQQQQQRILSQRHQQQQPKYKEDYQQDDISQESTAAVTNLALLQQDNDNNTWDNDDPNSQIDLVEEDASDIVHFDDSTLSAISSIKCFLRNTDLDWDNVKSLWTKTYVNRQEDIQIKLIKDVMEEWPKYLTERGIELFDIDFNMKFGCKSNILQEKWLNFEQKIHNYYQANIKDEVCKSLFTLYKTKPGKDSEDFILTVLLNAIILPTARYRDSNGNRRKISIVDAVDMFAYRLTHLNELEPKRQDILMRYGDLKHSDHGPHIIIVGDGNVTIHEIYVQFHVALYEMPDFLSAIDCCMKIYRVLNIPYPPANEYPWTFIQRYFYELSFDDDIKSPLMSSFLAFLKF